MGLGTLYGAEHSAMGLSTPLWGRGHSMGCSVVYWSILVYTGRRRPPLPVSLSVPLSDPPKGKWEEMGGGGAPILGQNLRFLGLFGPHFGAKSGHLGPNGAIWGQKSPIWGKMGSFLGSERPKFGAKGLISAQCSPIRGRRRRFWGEIARFWGPKVHLGAAFPHFGAESPILG